MRYHIEIPDFVFLLTIHFFADFGLQTNKQAEMKSKSNLYLFYHVSVYSLCWFISMYSFSGDIIGSLIFSVITFITHGMTDYVTSRISSRFFEQEDKHSGYVVMGFDQLVHYIQLMLTYYHIIVAPFYLYFL